MLDYRTDTTSDSIKFQVAYDATTTTLSTYYDIGSGFVVHNTMDATGTDWETEDFTMFVYGGAFADVTVRSGDVYADKFVAIPEPATLAFIGLFGGGLIVIRRIFSL